MVKHTMSGQMKITNRSAEGESPIKETIDKIKASGSIKLNEPSQMSLFNSKRLSLDANSLMYGYGT